MIWPSIEPNLGYPILAVCLVGLFVAGALWLWPEKVSPSSGGHSNTTHGKNAPINNAGRDVNNNYYPPPHLPPTRTEREPGDWPIAEAISAVQAEIGPERDAWLEFREAAHGDKIGVWGRPETTGPEILTQRRWGELRKAIPPHYWERWRIIRDLEGLRSSSIPHTEPEYGDATYDSFTSLTVDRYEVEKRWLGRGPDMYIFDPSPRGPHGWMG